MRHLLLIILSLCLASCGTPLTMEPLPTPVGISVAYPLYLQPTADRVSECAIQQQPLSLFIATSSLVQSNIPQPLLKLQLGGLIPEGSTAYQIGEEEITFIVNPDNPTTQLSTERLTEIYSGKMLHWDFGDHPFIEFVLYPEEDDLRAFVERNLLEMPRISFRAVIVSTPREVLNTVADHIEGFGYLPSNWVEDLDEEMQGRVKVLTLEADLAESLTQPVLAIVTEPVSPEMQEILACLQQSGD